MRVNGVVSCLLPLMPACENKHAINDMLTLIATDIIKFQFVQGTIKHSLIQLQGSELYFQTWHGLREVE